MGTLENQSVSTRRASGCQDSAIDAPEKGQPSGSRSKENVSRLVYDRNVRAECAKRDRYGREACKVLDRSIDVCLEQIRAGHAWWYRAYAKEQSPEKPQRDELAQLSP